MTNTEKELLQKYEALSGAVKKILAEWDPIGVLSHGDWPDDEYDSYIPSICSILMNSSDVSALESKLNALVELNMGLGNHRSRNSEFAAKLWKLRDKTKIGPTESKKANMPWIVKNLWLIPALPILATGLTALAHSTGAERRQTVAHGASRGYRVARVPSPGGATE